MSALDQDRALARLAADQHGVVTVSQLHALGLTKTAINHRVKRGRLHRVHLPKPLTNHHLRGLPGAPEVDFFFPDHGLAIETDGDEYHDTPIQRRADAAKQAKLEAAGLRVIRVGWDQATWGQEQTAQRVRRALTAR